MLVTDVYEDRNRFKIPTLWNIKNTAPYFHNNSAATLADVAEHYRKFFLIATPSPATAMPIVFTDQDKADLVAFMELL